MKEDLIKIRRLFHMYPELGLEEHETQKKIIKYLKAMDIPYKKVKTGIVGYINGTKSGAKRTVALRADMDALPIKEENSVLYKSRNVGKMHACGHDAHMTILIGAAMKLNERKDEFSGKVLLVFQPAEETVGGAKIIIKSGLLDDVDYIVGLHVSEKFDSGSVAIKYDQESASSDTIKITVHGITTHATKPHKGRDAVIIAANLLVLIQNIVSRMTSPHDTLVLSFGSIKGGTAHNVIADKVEILGTLRTINEKSRENTLKMIKNMIDNYARAMNTEINCEIEPGYPTLINDNKVMDVVKDCATDILGSNNVIIKNEVELGVEDFAYYTHKTKGGFYQLGTRNREKEIIYPTHSSKFDIDEDALLLGVKIQTEITLKLLNM